VYGAGTNDLTIVGTLDQVNADLATLTDSMASGSDTITVTAFDSAGNTAAFQTIAVTTGSGGGGGGSTNLVQNGRLRDRRFDGLGLIRTRTRTQVLPPTPW